MHFKRVSLHTRWLSVYVCYICFAEMRCVWSFSVASCRNDVSEPVPFEAFWPDTYGANDWHRSFWLWAIDIYNGSCWANSIEHVRSTVADILLSEETKVHDALAICAAESFALTSGWSMSITPCKQTAVERLSAGVAVGCGKWRE